jgi:hypothetical protein
VIQFERETWSDLEAALRREWLETNGLGGFASSTIIGLNTRRYHGLLVAATKPPVGRMVLLSKLEETMFIARTSLPAVAVCTRNNQQLRAPPVPRSRCND